MGNSSTKISAIKSITQRQPPTPSHAVVTPVGTDRITQPPVKSEVLTSSTAWNQFFSRLKPNRQIQMTQNTFDESTEEIVNLAESTIQLDDVSNETTNNNHIKENTLNKIVTIPIKSRYIRNYKQFNDSITKFNYDRGSDSSGYNRFQITSVSHYKQRRLRNANTIVSTQNNTNLLSHSVPPQKKFLSAENQMNFEDYQDEHTTPDQNIIDYRKLTKQASRSHTYLLAQNDDEPKMRYVRVVENSISEPDLFKQPTKSALKKSRTGSTRHLQVTEEPAPVSPIALNSDSFSLTPPTPHEFRHLCHVDPVDLSNTSRNIQAKSKIDLCRSSASWIRESADISERFHGDDMDNEWSVRAFTDAISEHNNPSMLSDRSEKQDEEAMELNEFEEDSIDIRPANKFIESDDDEFELNKVPRLHGRIIRRDSFANRLEPKHREQGDIRAFFETVNDGDNGFDDTEQLQYEIIDEHSEEITDVDSDEEDIMDRPIITEVLSPALCAAGYGPVGHLLTRWLPQRTFCELLIRNKGDEDESSEIKWTRRKNILQELAQTYSSSGDSLTHEMYMLRFCQFVKVQELEPYDRSADKPWTHLTPKEKALIRRELNDYKMAEMAVHQDSRRFTRFHPP